MKSKVALVSIRKRVPSAAARCGTATIDGSAACVSLLAGYCSLLLLRFLSRLEGEDFLHLVGAQPILRRQVVRYRTAQQDGGALALIVTDIRPVQLVTDQRRDIGGEILRDVRRIDQPLVLEGLEPAQRVAHHDAGARQLAAVGAGAVQRGTEEQQARAGV